MQLININDWDSRMTGDGKKLTLQNIYTMDIIPHSGRVVPAVIRSKDEMAKLNYTEGELKALPVTKLRPIASKRLKGDRGHGTWVAGAHKDELIQAILDGRRPVTSGSVDENPALTAALGVVAKEMAKQILIELREQSRGLT